MDNQNCYPLILFFLFMIGTKPLCAMQHTSWTKNVLISSAIVAVVGIVAKIVWDASTRDRIQDQQIREINQHLAFVMIKMIAQITKEIKITIAQKDLHLNEEVCMKLEEDEGFYSQLKELMTSDQSRAVLHSAARVLWQQRVLLDAIKSPDIEDQFTSLDNDLYVTLRNIVTSTEFWLEKV